MHTEIDLPNPKDRIKPGMYGIAKVILDTATKNSTLPAYCLVGESKDGNGDLFVIKDGKAKKTKVTVGADDGIRVEILSGITPDDEVIVNTGSVSDGVPVRGTPHVPDSSQSHTPQPNKHGPTRVIERDGGKLARDGQCDADAPFSWRTRCPPPDLTEWKPGDRVGHRRREFPPRSPAVSIGRESHVDDPHATPANAGVRRGTASTRARRTASSIVMMAQHESKRSTVQTTIPPGGTLTVLNEFTRYYPSVAGDPKYNPAFDLNHNGQIGQTDGRILLHSLPP